MHFVFIKAVKLDPCKSCPLIQLIDFAVISHSLLNSLYPVQSLVLSDLSVGSWWQLNVYREAQQVFRLSTAQDNVHLVHEAKNVATQAYLIHLTQPKEAVFWIFKIHQLVEEFRHKYSKQTVPKKPRQVCGRVLILWHNLLLPIRWGFIIQIYCEGA